MTATASFEDPYSLGDAREAPFLSSIIFKDFAQHLQRPGWKFYVVDSDRIPDEQKPDTRRRDALEVREVNCYNSQRPADAEQTAGCGLSAMNEVDASVGGLPSRIDHHLSCDVTAQAEDNRGDSAVSHSRSHPYDAHVSFHVRMEELERRMGEQLEVHRQLNAALQSLDTVSMSVRNAMTEDVVANMLQRRHEAAVEALNAGSVPPPCAHNKLFDLPVMGPPRYTPAPEVPSIVVTGVSGTKHATPTVVPSVAPLVKGKQRVSSKTPPQSQRKQQTTIVKAEEEPVPYVRKILRPKATHHEPFASPLHPGKSVSIVEATTVTHYDRDSPPLSAARRAAFVRGSVDTNRDSVRLSSSLDGKEGFPHSSIPSSQFSSSAYDSTAVSTSLPRSDSSSSNVRISFVDRNLASSRRSVTLGASVDDLVTLLSEDDSSSDSPRMVRDNSFGSTMRESVDSFRASAGGLGDVGGGRPKQLFDLFHRLCVRATNAIEHIEDCNAQRLGGGSHDRGGAAKREASPQNDAVEDVRDVLRLQHFVKVLSDDVKRLEAIRKARVTREKLIRRAQKVAAARRRMLRDKKISLAEVEDEIGVSLSTSVKKRRGDEDDILMEDSLAEDSELGFDLDGGMEDDFIVDEWGDRDDGGFVDDDEIGDEIDDLDMTAGGQDIEDLDEEALAATALLEEEEDLAEYLIDHDVDDMLHGSPPAQLRLIRYGGAKQPRHQSEPGASLARPESDHHSVHSSSSSFYSSVEDEEELAQFDRRRTAAATSVGRDDVFPVAAVEEDETLRRFHSDRHRGARGSSGSSLSSSVQSTASIHTSFASGGTDLSRPHGGSGQGGDDALLSPMKRTLSRKITSGQLKKTKSTAAMFQRHQSTATLRAMSRQRAPTPTVSEEDSYVRSSASSGDGDLGSSHDPFSTPYTSCTTVDSSVEIARMPMPADTQEKRKIIDRQRWMESEKRRRKALRTVVPLHTLSELYDPCESTPSGDASNSSCDHVSDTKRTGVLRSSEPGAPRLNPFSLTAGGETMASEGSFAALSPLSLASPAGTVAATKQTSEKITMLVGPDDLHRLLSVDPSSTRYSNNRESLASAKGAHQDLVQSGSEDSTGSSDAEFATSPPRGVSETPPPPPPVHNSWSSAHKLELLHPAPDEPPVETPYHSIEWSQRAQNGDGGGADKHSSTTPNGSLLRGSLQDGLAPPPPASSRRAPPTEADADHVRIGGQSPFLPAEETQAARDYNVDDLVAIDAWKTRQMSAIREGLLLTRTESNTDSHEEESRWADEASAHWAAVETLLANRFGKRGDDISGIVYSDESDSTYTYDEEDVYSSTLTSEDERGADGYVSSDGPPPS